jgi:outer membrane protein TolC
MNVMAVALALAVAQAPGQATNPPAPDAPAPARSQPAGAEASPGRGAALPVVTLEDALRAGEGTLDLRILRAQLDQAEEISWKALSGYLPQLTASGVYTRQEEVVVPELGNLEIQSANQVNAQVELTQNLFSPSLFYGIRGANRTERATELNIENGRRALFFGIARAYYGAASLRQGVEVSERLLEIAARQERDARVRFQAGTIARVGLLRAEIDRARAEQDLLRARNAYDSARLALATLLGRDVAFEVTAPPEPALPAAAGEDALVAQAIRSRPDVQAARVAAEAARANRSAAYGRYFPNVGAFGRYQWANAAGFTGRNESWSGGIQAQWQILDGLLRESDIREASAIVAESEAQAARLELAVAEEVRRALLDLESARANAIKAREQRDLAAENLRLVDVSYRAGAATAVEQADATAALRNAEIGLQTESLQAQLAALGVLLAAGEFDPVPRRR